MTFAFALGIFFRELYHSTCEDVTICAARPLLLYHRCRELELKITDIKGIKVDKKVY